MENRKIWPLITASNRRLDISRRWIVDLQCLRQPSPTTNLFRLAVSDERLTTGTLPVPPFLHLWYRVASRTRASSAPSEPVILSSLPSTYRVREARMKTAPAGCRVLCGRNPGGWHPRSLLSPVGTAQSPTAASLSSLRDSNPHRTPTPDSAQRTRSIRG